jgi:hypothetical protein
VLEDEVLDVPLVARLRPAALVVPARLLLCAVDDLPKPPRAQPEELATLPPDHRDDRAVAPDERRERRQAERRPNADRVADRLGQRQRPPDAVEPGAEEREAARAVAVEVGVEEAADALEVGLEPLALLVRQAVALRRVALLCRVEERVDLRRHLRGCRRIGRVEVEEDADRAALAGAEAGEVSKLVPADGCRHVALLSRGRAF